MKPVKTKKLTSAAMLFAIGLILPFITGHIQQIGNMLLPMHFPVLLCGLICGWKYGLMVGFLLPLVRSALFGMPVIYPNAISMVFELSAYGAIVGALYFHEGYFCIRSLYRSLVIAMAAGRVVWGAAMILLLDLRGGAFTWQMFLSGAFLNAIPGIILQLTLIPGIMLALNKTGLLPSETSKV